MAPKLDHQQSTKNNQERKASKLDQQQGTKNNQERNKMVPTKARGSIGLNGPSRDNPTRGSIVVRNFKVYSESGTAKVDSYIRRKLVPDNKGSSLVNTFGLKGGLKTTEKSKGMNECGARTNVQRRALADISNINGDSSCNPKHNGGKPTVSIGLATRMTTVSSRKSILGRAWGNLGQVVSHSRTSMRVGKDSKVPSDDQRIKATGLIREAIITNGRTAINTVTQTRKSLPVLKRVDQADKSIPKPIMKTTIKTSTVKRNSKAQYTSGPNKTVTSTSLKKEEVVTSSLSENIVYEASCIELPSDSHCKPSMLDTISRGKSNRRRSYTSLLMERLKLLEEHGEVMEHEKLPSIDDDGNQLEVADYVDEIYQYYWVTEAQNPPLANYMSSQKDITPHMRAILINWLIEVHFKFDLMQETLYLMVTLLDLYLSQVTIEKNELQLVGLTVLLLASKYEDFWHPRVKDLISISAESYTRDQMLGMENLILKKLKFRLNAPTPYVFMLRFLKAAQSDTKLEHLAFYLIELSLVEYEALMFKPSLLCASAIYIARCTLQMTPWTPLLCQHARYEVSQIRDCAELMLRLQKAARGGHLKFTYEKYMSPELSGVAAIKPMDSLPL